VAQRAAQPRRQRVVRTVRAGEMIIFMGSRFAHANVTKGKCARLAGWVCAAGSRVETDEGTEVY
jgi:hypothetical protein